jgi:hypothetical protein
MATTNFTDDHCTYHGITCYHCGETERPVTDPAIETAEEWTCKYCGGLIKFLIVDETGEVIND